MLLSGSNRLLAQHERHGEKQEEKERGGRRRNGILSKAIIKHNIKAVCYPFVIPP